MILLIFLLSSNPVTWDTVYTREAQDTYVHLPGNYSVTTYVHIDDVYAEWYAAQNNGHQLDRSMVLPINIHHTQQMHLQGNL